MKEFMRKKEFVILSAELGNRTRAENKRASLNLEACLDDLGLEYKEVMGSYKGQREISFMVMTPCEETMRAVKDLGLKSFKQESVLFRDWEGQVFLCYKSGVEKLGKFVEMCETQVYTEKAWTRVGNKYWIVK